MDYKKSFEELGKRSKVASHSLCVMPTVKKNRCLQAIADAILSNQKCILEANEIDINNGVKNNLSDAIIDRLRLTPDRMKDIANGVRKIVELPDPVGSLDSEFSLENGIAIRKVRVPIGVIGIIYESRPNVTVDAATLCLKAGNAVILKGGSEAVHSNKALVSTMANAISNQGIDPAIIQIVPWTDRDATPHFLKLNTYVDLIIPRGGQGLINFVAENATIPVIKHFKGVCHIYVDRDANQDMALSIIENAKCQRPGVCNAVETVLIHSEIAQQFATRLAKVLQSKGVELRGDSKFCALTSVDKLATETDWYEEYLDLILAVKVVSDTDEAIKHIATYGSNHSDAIISENNATANRFLSEVDSAVVYVNASTRFTDGSAFGMGAEIGISTDRIHARGPMGLMELTSYKYLAVGNGQIRD